MFTHFWPLHVLSQRALVKVVRLATCSHDLRGMSRSYKSLSRVAVFPSCAAWPYSAYAATRKNMKFDHCCTCYTHTSLDCFCIDMSFNFSSFFSNAIPAGYLFFQVIRG